MTLNLVIVTVAEVVSLILTLMGWVTEIGFLNVGGMVIGMLIGGEILSTGTGNLVWGSIVLSSSDGLVLLMVVSVLTIIESGILLKMRVQ